MVSRFADSPHPTALAAAIIRSDLVAPWENSNYLASVRDSSGRLLAVNLSFARCFGKPTASWTGFDLAQLIEPEDLSLWRSLLRTLEKPPHRIEHETRWITAQGVRWFSWEETAILDESGRARHFRAIGREVTRQRQAEELSHKLSSAFEQSPVALVITDLDGVVHYANPRFFSVIGASLDEINQKRLPVLPPSMEGSLSCIDTVKAGREWRGEISSRGKDGALRWENVQVSPIRSPSGAPTHLLCLREDITERKHLEEQLRQSQKMESLGTLAGGIAHDFNNMLAIINGYTELSMARALSGNDDALRRYLREIQGTAQRAVGMVQRILTFSRKTEVRVAPVNLNKMIRELGALLAETFPRTIAFDYDLCDSLPMLAGDHSQLQQVIMNLCVNARDAMPKGGRLTLSTQLVPGAELSRIGGNASQDYISLNVSDMGVGMTSQVKAHIFEPFFTTKQEAGGTGLGLAVVYGIILNHLGLLDVESAPGQGSTFRVYFPVGALQPVQTAPVAIRSVADLPRGKESLLIVEDEVSLRSLMLNVLEPCGYKVDMALDGREALLRIENEQLHYDCILLDLNLPELHGLEVFREIKRIRPRTPVLVVSGNITAEIKAKMVALGQNEFLPKPYRLDDLCLQLRSVLDRCAGSV